MYRSCFSLVTYSYALTAASIVQTYEIERAKKKHNTFNSWTHLEKCNRHFFKMISVRYPKNSSDLGLESKTFEML